MTKQELLDLLEGVKQSTLLGYALMEHAEQGGWREVSKKCMAASSFPIGCGSFRRHESRYLTS